MPLEDTAILGIIILNVILTIILAIIYFRSYRTISSKMTLGLVIFAVAFLAEHILNFFFYNSLLEQGITGITTFHFTVNVLQMIALLILVWVTLK